MPANAAKCLLSIAGTDLVNFDVTRFSGVDAISGPYSFDVEFRMPDSSRSAPPPNTGIIDAACRLDIERNGETISYCGIIVEFYTCNFDDANYKIRLAPHMYRLSLNSSNRIFQRLTVPEIIERVVKEAGLKEYFRFDLNPSNIKYPMREFCVQHQETDLAFISRLMEDSGIWYYFEQVKQPNGTLKERAVVTDDFASFPLLGRQIPFMRGSGFVETKTQTSPIKDLLGITNSGDNVVESINYIYTRATLLPKSVRVRSYTHRYPEAMPEGFSDVKDGHLGRVYEYGGTINNLCEAEHRATLHARRLWIESSQIDGKGNCAAFRAGLRVPITHDEYMPLAGMYLLISVKHEGGWDNGAYTYKNEFTSIRAEHEIYAPSLRTPVPRIDGVTTAPVGATNDMFPTLNEYGNYTVNMPSALDYGKNDTGQGGDYDRSKNIRLAQPSCGVSGEDKTPYGIHFPSKRGAEMVLAYVDGNPDRPIGLGFVPNAASPSVVRNTNHMENIMRSWGGNELVMDDNPRNKSIKLSTPDGRYLELHDENELVKIKSSDCELLFNDAGQFTQIDVGGHKIHIDYADDSGAISITTVKGNAIKMSDQGDVITIQNFGVDNKIILNGDDKSITLDCMDNKIIANGKDNKISIKSDDSIAILDGNGKKIVLENKDNKVVIDSNDNTIILNAGKNINIKSGGKTILDAKNGIVNKGQTIGIDNGGSSNSNRTGSNTSAAVVGTNDTGDRTGGVGNTGNAENAGDATTADKQQVIHNDGDYDSQETEAESEVTTLETNPEDSHKIVDNVCTYTAGYSDNWRCGNENKSQIHEKLTCKHYSKIRDLLESNLSENELFMFNSLEYNMAVDDAQSSRFTFNPVSGHVLTNIEDDANLRPSRTKYQSTIHELWHNMDFVAGRQFGSRWRNRANTEIRAQAARMRIEAEERGQNLPPNFPTHEEIKSIEVNTISYLYEDNLLGRTINAELSQTITIDGVSKRRREFYVDELNKLERVRRNVENEHGDITDINYSTINTLYPRHNEKMSGFHYLSDIIIGENNLYNRDMNPRVRYTARNKYKDYFGRNNPKGEVFLATEYFAAIGCMKAANPDFFYMMRDLTDKLNLRESYRIYTDIISFIRRQLEGRP